VPLEQAVKRVRHDRATWNRLDLHGRGDFVPRPIEDDEQAVQVIELIRATPVPEPWTIGIDVA
jgi:hypothetical protein